MGSVSVRVYQESSLKEGGGSGPADGQRIGL